MVKNFRRNDPLTLIVHMRFSRLIFVAAIDYENIFTTKISRFMVHALCVYAKIFARMYMYLYGLMKVWR